MDIAFRFSRVLLIVGVCGAGCCALLLIPAAWPWSAYVFGIGVFLWMRKQTAQLTTLGSARYASEDDLRYRHMLNARTGLILGRLTTRRGMRSAVKALCSPRLTSTDACREFWTSIRGRAPLVRLAGAVHTTVIAPTGQGKGTSFVIPFLRTCSDSCVVVDFKGENARLTAEHRRKVFGHRIVLLDPFHMVTGSPDTLNALDGIDKDNRVAIDECNDLANALVIRTGEERDPHWNDSAECWIAAILALVVFYGEREHGTRSLQTVRDLLADPQKLEMAIKALCESDGMLSRLGGQLRHFVDKEKSSTLTTLGRHLRFLDTLAVADSTRSSSFDPAELRKGRMTVYLILPPEHMRAQSALLRLWIGALLRAVVRGGLQEQTLVHFVLDEMASVGRLDAIDDALDKYRGFGIRLQLYFQSMGQLKRCFPEGQDVTLLSNTTQVFFGVNDPTTADYVSARLGDETVVVDSGGSSWGNSAQRSEGAQPSNSYGGSSNYSSNWGQQARRLLKPEEVAGLSPRLAITFTPGVPPILTRLVRSYEEPKLGQPKGTLTKLFEAGAILLLSTVLVTSTLGGAVLLAATTQARIRATPSAPAVQTRPSSRRIPTSSRRHSRRANHYPKAR